MKILKKSYPLIGLLVLGSSILLGVEGYINKIQLINKIHELVFGKANLFERENKSLDEWAYLLDETLKVYVGQNAGGDKNLLEAFSLCDEVSFQLMDVLEVVYDVVFKNKKTSTPGAIFSARNAIATLNGRIQSLNEMETSLGSPFYFLINKEKRGVKKVLMHLIIVLKNTIAKLDKDFDKQLQLRFGL